MFSLRKTVLIKIIIENVFTSTIVLEFVRVVQNQDLYLSNMKGALILFFNETVLKTTSRFKVLPLLLFITKFVEK